MVHLYPCWGLIWAALPLRKGWNRQNWISFITWSTSQEIESLASEIFDLQNRYGFPGLVSECKGLIKTYGLPYILNGQLNLSKVAWKKSIKSGMIEHSEKLIKEKSCQYSKLKYITFENENLQLKDSVQSMQLRDARTMFCIRSGMVKTKMNMKSSRNYSMDSWKCNDCRSMDFQSHIVWYPA